MGLLDSIKGKLDDIATKEIEKLLLPNEIVEHKFPSIEDTVVLTDKRLIFIDNKILSSGKSYISIPFKNISTIFIQKPSAGTFKVREIGVTVGSFKYEFKAPDDGMELYKMLLEKTI